MIHHAQPVSIDEGHLYYDIVSETLFLTPKVGLTTSSIAPPKDQKPFGDFSPESKGCIRCIFNWPSTPALLGRRDSLPWAGLIARQVWRISDFKHPRME
jgi:hypothetical protein